MDKRKKIGLVGFFGWGNFGDELFVQVFEQWLGDDFELKVLNDLTYKPYFSRSIEEVVEEVDAIVIGGGDLVIPWAMSDLYWRNEYLIKPVFIVGIGVPTWGERKPHIIERYNKFLAHDNVKYINVRDRESAAWIENNISCSIPVEHSADIVFSLAMPAKVVSDEKFFGIVTRDRKGAPDDLTEVKRLAIKALSEGFKVKHIILGSGDVGRRDLSRANDLDVEDKVIVYSDSLEELCQEISTCTMLASMKFHGTVVAINYGIPSIVLSATDKNRNLMRMIERRELLSSLKDSSLPDRVHPFVPSIPWTSVRMLRQRAEGTMKKLHGLLSELPGV
ncbi:polysaccharide pyruvyl transferase family protein [uncultured Microbulbifer sp.]|uniref:polysaccharide pyruvyl transferase family protein n=1 Tax=uncultured Microbulbifer sp. TaxID=348147 RepID=UPI002636C60C|nr:polysaccharide pyruvyl transferase family protein [uncultured Microbulbifer sp.]